MRYKGFNSRYRLLVKGVSRSNRNHGNGEPPIEETKVNSNICFQPSHAMYVSIQCDRNPFELPFRCNERTKICSRKERKPLHDPVAAGPGPLPSRYGRISAALRECALGAGQQVHFPHVSLANVRPRIAFTLKASLRWMTYQG